MSKIAWRSASMDKFQEVAYETPDRSQAANDALAWLIKYVSCLEYAVTEIGGWDYFEGEWEK